MDLAERKKGEMTVGEAGHLGIKKVASKGGKATAAKVPRIQEEYREMDERKWQGWERGEEKGEMTVREAGHLGGKKGGHIGGKKGGEVTASKVERIREENKEREAPTKEERERVNELVDRLKKE